MSKKKPAKAPNVSPEESLPGQIRPTQGAFTPLSNKAMWQGVVIGFVCFLGVALGLAAWFDPTILNDQTASSTVGGGIWLTILLPFIFPVFLPIGLYFWGDTWRHWQRTRLFMRSKETTPGVITHLWLDPPRPPGKRYFVGYRFGEGQSAYQETNIYTYRRLTVGAEVVVEYVPHKPLLSRLDLPNKK